MITRIQNSHYRYNDIVDTSHSRLADGVSLLNVRGGGQVPGATLQVVGHRPVVLVAQGLFHHVCQSRRDTAKLLPAPSDCDQEDDAAEVLNDDEEGKRLPPKP